MPPIRRHSLSPIVILLGLAAVGAAASHAATWQPIGPDGGLVSQFVIAPSNPSFVYAGTRGGVFASQDGGRSWQPSHALFTQPSDMAVDPRNPRVAFAISGFQLLRTADGGQTWSPSTYGLPRSPAAVQCLASSPAGRGFVYAVAFRDGEPLRQDVYRSSDHGSSWQRRSRGTGVFSDGDICMTLFADPLDAQHLVAGSTHGLATSTDGGATWSDVQDLSGARIITIAGSGRAPRTLYVGVQGGEGVYRSRDGGRHWQPAAGGLPGAPVLSLLVDPAAPSTVIAALASVPPFGTPLFRTRDGGRSWEPIAGSPIDVKALAASLVPRGAFFAGVEPAAGETVGALVSRNGGNTWVRSDAGLQATDVEQLAITGGGTVYAALRNAGLYRRDGGGWTRVLADSVVGVTTDRFDASTVYACGASLWRSTDGGATFERIGDFADQVLSDTQDPHRLFARSVADVRLSADDGATWTTVIDSFTFGLVQGPTGTLYASQFFANDDGSSASLVLRSTDHGVTWQSRGDVLHEGALELLGTDTGADGIVFARLGVSFLRSDDGGLTWVTIGDGLDGYVTALWADTKIGERIHVGTSKGLQFVSDDDGSTFRREGDGQPLPRPAQTLAGDPNEDALYAGTLDAGVWRVAPTY